MDNTVLIISLVILVLFSGFFSATETAFSCVNKLRLKSLAETNKKAKKVLELSEDFDSLLSTILVGNNIVNIASTAIATVLFTRIFHDAGAAVSTLVMTIAVLIFGEITPKSIAKEAPEKFCLAVLGPISFFKTILRPINWFFSLWKKLVYNLINIENEEAIAQEELLLMVEEAQSEGELEEHESDLISAAIEFNDLDVKEILTPRVDVIAVSIDTSLDQIEEMFRENNYSRFPIYEGTVDNIIGVLHEKDFYYLFYKKKSMNIKSIVKKVQFTSPHVKISYLLRQLQSSKSHMAIVIDEYGGTAGIITMEDILEELVGEIYDEHDEVIEYFKQIDETHWLIECDANLEDMFEHFEIDINEEYDFITVGGWVIHHMNKIPKVGDAFHFENYEVSVVKCDERHVEQVVFHKIAERENNED